MSNTTTTTKKIWIDESYDQPGTIGFLIERSHILKGWDRLSIQDRPAHTNQSHCPRLKGWCGTTNDVAVYAKGLARVVKHAKNGRTQVELIPTTSPDGQAALEALGYPDLTDED